MLVLRRNNGNKTGTGQGWEEEVNRGSKRGNDNHVNTMVPDSSGLENSSGGGCNSTARHVTCQLYVCAYGLARFTTMTTMVMRSCSQKM